MVRSRIAPGIMGAMSQTVVIAGAAGPLGRRVAALAAADDDVTRVLAVGPGVLAAEMPPSIDTRAVALDDPEIKGFLAEADVLVHLGSGEGHGPDGLPASPSPAADLADTRALLDAAAAVGVGHVVILSSAMVYGAWANNPVPLTEDAPLRPDPGLPYASAKAESERLVFEWRAAQSGEVPKVAVLRPAVSVSGESTEWLSTSPWSAAAAAGVGHRSAQPVPAPRRLGLGGRPRPPRVARRPLQRRPRRLDAGRRAP